MVLLSGCTQSNIVNPESETKIADPNFDIQDDIETVSYTHLGIRIDGTEDS